MKINIEGLNPVNDPFYRYQMEKIEVTKLRTKNSINNIDQVAYDLERDPKLLIQFLKLKFNCTLKYKDGVVQTFAKLDQVAMEKAVKEFIEYFVLCEKCRLPETQLKFRKESIYKRCKCCSENTNISKYTKMNKIIAKTYDYLVKEVGRSKKSKR